MTRELDAALQAVRDAPEEAAANGAAFSDADYVRALKLSSIGEETFDDHNARLDSIATRIDRAAEMAQRTLSLEAQVAFWQIRARASQDALSALVKDPSFPDISDAGLESAAQALAEANETHKLFNTQGTKK